jgi:hypothetical protein
VIKLDVAFAASISVTVPVPRWFACPPLKQGRRVWQGLRHFAHAGSTLPQVGFRIQKELPGYDHLLPGLQSFADLALAAALHSNFDIHNRELAFALRNDDDAAGAGTDDGLGRDDRPPGATPSAKLTVTNIPGTSRLPGWELDPRFEGARGRVHVGERALTRPLST